MLAIQFDAAIPRYVLGQVAARVWPALLWGGPATTFARDVPIPALIGPHWTRVRTRYGGICGSDLSAIHLHTSPYFSPYSSFPFTLGHENVGVLDEVGPAAADAGWQVGDRVIVEPALWCRPRGFDELCPFCAQGQINRCLNLMKGDLAPGLFTGSCATTGGSWSSHFLAHSSQLYRVPDTVSDENALMVEPFACAVHAVLQNRPAPGETVLVVGAGTMGLMTLAALKQIAPDARVISTARYPFQAEAARRLGANDIISGAADLYTAVAAATGATLARPIIGKRVMTGGADLTFECVGSDSALDDALRFTNSGGRVVLVGVPGLARGVDWSAIFLQELTVRAAYIYDRAETYEGQTWTTFGLALDWLAKGQLDLSWLVTHRYELAQYGQALSEHGDRRRHQILKAVFAFPDV